MLKAIVFYFSLILACNSNEIKPEFNKEYLEPLNKKELMKNEILLNESFHKNDNSNSTQKNASRLGLSSYLEMDIFYVEENYKDTKDSYEYSSYENDTSIIQNNHQPEKCSVNQTWSKSIFIDCSIRNQKFCSCLKIKNDEILTFQHMDCQSKISKFCNCIDEILRSESFQKELMDEKISKTETSRNICKKFEVKLKLKIQDDLGLSHADKESLILKSHFYRDWENPISSHNSNLIHQNKIKESEELAHFNTNQFGTIENDSRILFEKDQEPNFYILLPKDVHSCENIPVHARFISKIPKNIKKINWELVGSSGTLENALKLRKYIKSQNFLKFYIPAGFLEPGQAYNISLELFIDEKTEPWQTWVTTETNQDRHPDVVFDSEALMQMPIGKKNYINIIPFYSECLSAADEFSVKFLHNSQQSFDILNYINPNDPLFIEIPKCSLVPNQLSNFTANVYLNNQPKNFKELELSVIGTKEIFSIKIIDSIRRHLYDQDLLLISSNPKVECLEFEQLVYIWTCQNNGGICKDSNGNFEKETNLSKITISRDDFSVGDTLDILLKVFFSRGEAIARAKIAIISDDQIPIKVDVDSLSPFLSLSSKNSILQVNSSKKIDENSKIILDLDLPIQTTIYNSIIKLHRSMDFSVSSSPNLRVKLTIDLNSFYFELPLNTPPKSGNIDIFPKEGISLLTYFSISAFSWEDQDGPLQYQFFFAFEKDETKYLCLTKPQQISYTSTLIPGVYPSTNIFVKVQIRDSFDAASEKTTTVRVISESDSLFESELKVSNLIAKVSKSNPEQSSKLYMLAASEIVSWENYLLDNLLSNQNLTCSGHGRVFEGGCMCEDDWKFLDCSIYVQNFKKLMEFKHELAIKARQLFEAHPRSIIKNYTFSTFGLLSKNSYFNNNITLRYITDVMVYSFRMLETKKEYSLEDINSVSAVIDNVLVFINNTDQGIITEYSKSILNMVVNTFDIIAKHMSRDIIPNEIALFEAKSFSLYISRTFSCQIHSSNFKISNGLIETYIKIENKKLDCEKSIIVFGLFLNLRLRNFNLQFRTNLDNFFIKILDENWKENKFNLRISEFQSFEELLEICPFDCHIKNDECICLKDTNSDFHSYFLNQILKSTEEKFSFKDKLIQSGLYAVILLASIIFVIANLILSLAISKFCIPKYDSIEKFKNMKKFDSWAKFKAMFIALSPLLNSLLIYKFHFLDKHTRCILVYLRYLILIFASGVIAASIQDINTNFHQEFLFILCATMGLTLFIRIIEYCIKVPSQKALKKSDKKARLKLIDTAKSRQCWGYLLILNLILGINIAIALLLFDLNRKLSFLWSKNIIGFFFYDLFINPILNIIIQESLNRIFSKEKIQKMSCIRKLIGINLDITYYNLIDILKHSKKKSISIGDTLKNQAPASIDVVHVTTNAEVITPRNDTSRTVITEIDLNSIFKRPMNQMRPETPSNLNLLNEESIIKLERRNSDDQNKIIFNQLRTITENSNENNASPLKRVRTRFIFDVDKLKSFPQMEDLETIKSNPEEKKIENITLVDSDAIKSDQKVDISVNM